VIVYKEKKETYKKYVEANERTQRYQIFFSMNSKDYAKTFQLKKANMKKIFYLFSEGKKQAKRILKDYNIKNEIFYISRNLTNEQQNISRAMFIIKEKRVVSQYIPDFSFER
jgi:hypothetical protein